jgi:hypothetical protein
MGNKLRMVSVVREAWRLAFMPSGPTYYRTTDYYVLAVRTVLTTYDDVQTVCADRLDYYWTTYDVLTYDVLTHDVLTVDLV